MGLADALAGHGLVEVAVGLAHELAPVLVTEALVAESEAAVCAAVADLRGRGYALRVERRSGAGIHPDVGTAVIVAVVRQPQRAAA